MKVFLLLIASAALAAACPPIFNDFYYLGNATHTTADLVRETMEKQSKDQPQLDWTEIITKNRPALSTWPRGRITYCYKSPDSRNRLVHDIDDAWSLWSRLLGPYGEDGKHKLQFYEYEFWDKEWPYCYLEHRKDDDPWIWNPKVPYSVALIDETTRHVPGVPPSAICGYIPHDWPGVRERGRMGLRLNMHGDQDYQPREFWIATLAHELGLKGYDEAKSRVWSQGRHSMDEVCADGVIAASYGFYEVESFSKHDVLDPGATKVGLNYPWYQNFPENDYDHFSLMHYSSNPKDWYDDNEKIRSALTFWKRGGPNFVPPTTVTKDDLDFSYHRSGPSYRDIEAIRMLYPYMQYGFEDGARSGQR